MIVKKITKLSRFLAILFCSMSGCAGINFDDSVSGEANIKNRLGVRPGFILLQSSELDFLLRGNTLNISSYIPPDLFNSRYSIYISGSGRGFLQYDEFGYGVIPIEEPESVGSRVSVNFRANSVEFSGTYRKNSRENFRFDVNALIFRNNANELECYFSGLGYGGYYRQQCSIGRGNTLRVRMQ
jgi:hypothetical protein